MEILRFRTSANSPWVEIAAIKGDKGDSYILTEEDKKEIAEMIDVGDVDVDLSDYALKSDLLNYALKTDLTLYALKSELPDVSGFMTEAQVQALINSAIGSIENGNEVYY